MLVYKNQILWGFFNAFYITKPIFLHHSSFFSHSPEEQFKCSNCQAQVN